MPATSPRMSAKSNIKAAMWMGCAIACLVLMAWSGREVTRHIPVLLAMELRSILGLLMLSPLIAWHGGFAALATRRLSTHVGRNVAHYAGQVGWVAALGMIPLAQLVAIEFTSPIWAAFIAMAFLGERMTLPKCLAIGLGLLGVLIIVRPGIADYDIGQIIVLFAAIAFAISLTMTKSLTNTEATVPIIFWMLVIQSIIGLVPAIITWQTPPIELVPWLLLFGFSGTYAHVFMTRALSHADVMVVIPMDFLRVPAMAALGWFAYSEAVDSYTVAGSILIIAANSLNIIRRRTSPTPSGSP